jgi:hypothetical protein
MAGSRTGTGATTTYTFTWTGANLDAIADAAARRIYAMHDGTDYDSLTVQQRVNILDAYIAEMLTEQAAVYTHTTELKAAQVKAQAFIENNLRMK